MGQTSTQSAQTGSLAGSPHKTHAGGESLSTRARAPDCHNLIMPDKVPDKPGGLPLPFPAKRTDNWPMASSLLESNRDLQRRLTHAATVFSAHAFLHERCADELVSRLDLLRIAPETILDAGAATGALAQRLAQRYPGAQVTAAELNQALAATMPEVGALKRLLGRTRAVQRLAAALDDLPLGDDSVDLVASNLALPRFAEPDAVLAEVARVLKPGGAFSFVTLGPDTLRELREAWGDVDDGVHVATFTDMHDIGDALGRAGFAEPVLDVDTLALTYNDVGALWRDLSALGARNCLPGRQRGLTGRTRFGDMCDRLMRDGTLRLSVELVYAQCWGTAGPHKSGEVAIRPDAIGMRRRDG
ncbi:MAG: methyltransferase domain-containing protein [Pseudomonadota bacterium]